MKKHISRSIIRWTGLAAFFGLIFLLLPKPEGMPEEADGKLPLAQTIARRFTQEYLMTRDPNLNRIPRERILKAYDIAQAKRAMRAGDDLAIFWDERGPNNVGGRTRGVLIDANDASGQTVWAGGVAGGLWRTNDIDAANPTWVPINDLFQNLALSTIAQDPNAPNNMFFGTGECWGNQDAVSGLGVWSSTDGGATWDRMPALNANGTNPCIVKLIVDNSGTLFAATTGGLRWFNSLNNTWPTLLGNGVFANSNFITDLEIAANGDMYAATYFDGVYISTNAGTTWNPINTGLPTMNFGRIELACAPSNASTAYVIFADTTTANSGGCLSFFQTTNSGTSWTAATCPGGFGTQAWYDLILAVDPTDEDRVWAGGVGIFVSADGGANWTGLGGIHADHHAIVYYPNDPDQILFGNDGGMYKSYDGSNASPTFANKNSSYNVTQFYAVAMHPDLGSNYMIGGTQDNATPKFTNPGLSSTSCVLCCCDGGWAFVDEDNPMVQIASTQDGSFNVSTDGGVTFGNIVPGNDDRIFITPAEYDHTANILYYSDLNGRFGRVSDIGGANTNTSDSIPAFGGAKISAFAVSPTIANRVYMGSTNGRLYQVDNADQAGMTTVAFMNNPATNGWMSSIAVDPGNEMHILITLSNFGVNSIWETPDGGTTWTSVEGDLPDLPVRWIIFWPGQNDKAMIATELGVWYTKDLDGTNTVWYPTNEFGLANCRVDMLRARTSDKVIAAATHGRGIYSTDYFHLLDSCKVSLNIPGNIPSGLYMASDFISSDGTVADGSTVIFHAGDYVELLPDFTAEKGSNFWALIKECTAGALLTTGEDESQKGPWALKAKNVAPPETVQPQSAFRIPEGGTLRAFPNPARTAGTILFDLPEAGNVRLYIMDTHGQIAATLVSGNMDAGSHSQEFDATTLPGGVYLVVLKANALTRTERIVIVE